jgi:hypothetical protein
VLGDQDRSGLARTTGLELNIFFIFSVYTTYANGQAMFIMLLSNNRTSTVTESRDRWSRCQALANQLKQQSLEQPIPTTPLPLLVTPPGLNGEAPPSETSK